LGIGRAPAARFLSGGFAALVFHLVAEKPLVVFV
jgi:hypothetical protein